MKILIPFSNLVVLLFFSVSVLAQESSGLEGDSLTQEQQVIYKEVDVFPWFWNAECEKIEDVQERKRCADYKMLEYIYKNIIYPEIAIVNEIEGYCVVQFVVRKNGEISDIKLVRDIGGGCGTECVRVVQKMAEDEVRWVPGYHEGEAVDVQFNLPVKFMLTD